MEKELMDADDLAMDNEIDRLKRPTSKNFIGIGFTSKRKAVFEVCFQCGYSPCACNEGEGWADTYEGP